MNPTFSRSEEPKEAVSPPDSEAEDDDDTILLYDRRSSTWRNIMREADIEPIGPYEPVEPDDIKIDRD